MLVMFWVRFFYVKISVPLSLLSEIIMGQRSPCIVQIVIDIGILSFSKVCKWRIEGIKSKILNQKFSQYSHFTSVAPHVNPPPKAASTIRSPLFISCLKSHRQRGMVAAVVLP